MHMMSYMMMIDIRYELIKQHIYLTQLNVKDYGNTKRFRKQSEIEWMKPLGCSNGKLRVMELNKLTSNKILG